jgi:transposase
MIESHRIQNIQDTYQVLSPHLNEKARRLWAASQARDLGWGGVSTIADLTGLSRVTIHLGLTEIKNIQLTGDHRIRKVGGGRKKITEKHPRLLTDLEALVEPLTRGDPESPLRWTCKSTRNLAEELSKKNYNITQRTVCALLEDLGYSLQSNRKTREGSQNPDRNSQFEFIYQKIKRFQKKNYPVISVDTKKKELLGNFKNAGQEYNPKKTPTEVECHEFKKKGVEKAAPYGVYDLTKNSGWVSVNMSSDTSEFAVATIKRWWHKMGKKLYSGATDILITADCGGSNGYRVRLWKRELQRLADESKLTIHVSHFPPGTSKWNKIEHKLFSFITKNWRGHPLTDSATIVNLIGATTTKKGLLVKSEIDSAVYRKGIKIPDDEFKKLRIFPEEFHGEWNYEIKPKR